MKKCAVRPVRAERARSWSPGIGRALAVIVVALSLTAHFTTARAGANFAAPLCGNGSAPDYGFTYDLQQEHWTVDWQGRASEQAVSEVDMVLDRLNEDSIAQTMILIQPQDQVANRVNCAVHFLRYMRLGLPTGARKDNGFVFLIVIEPTRLDVHYGVGLGLPALTAPELSSVNRAAEETYQSTHSMDQALLTLVQEFDRVARGKYAPLNPPTPTNLPPSEPLGVVPMCGLLCMGIFFLLFMMWVLSEMARMGVSFNPSGFGSRGSGSSWGRGGSFGRGGFSGGSGRSSPPTRGGSGSGRSGRGN